LLYTVIIAGGKGERFWPKSVRAMPKQFHSIVTGRTMIQETFHRVYPEIARDCIFISSGAHLTELIRSQLPELDENNLIVEPMGRNTAPAIGLAAAVLHRREQDAVVAVLSADHVIHPREAFLDALNDARKVAEGGFIVTFGIEPTRPATEFGYIELDCSMGERLDHEVYTVKRFREKPSYGQAEEYVKAGSFLWNSGMFVFQASTLLGAMKIHMPSLYRGLMRIADNLGTEQEDRVKCEEFEGFESISIDYGIMEKFEHIACLKPGFAWDDVGSWSALERHRPADERGNILDGNVIAVDSRDSIVIGDGKSVISLIGMRDTIVVKEGERILICHKRADQKIKDALRIMEDDETNARHL
jgi:mannose-1-phosphate guanylyltransferase